MTIERNRDIWSQRMPLDFLGVLLIVAAIVLSGRLTGNGIASIDQIPTPGPGSVPESLV